MGGSGSGGWTPTPPKSSCEKIAFRANVNSPQPGALANLQVGHVLNVKLQTVPTTAVVVEHAGVTVGALTGASVNELVNCLQNGYTYTASVVSLTGGNCTVDVRHT